VYSAIPYKTPWCALNVELPLFLLCGWSAHQGVLAARDPGQTILSRLAALALVILPLAGTAALLDQTRTVSNSAFADSRYGYVFVQTEEGYFQLLQDLFGISDLEQFAEGPGPRVVNVDPKNPTRWYTITRGWHYDARDYRNGEAPGANRIRRADIVLVVRRSRQETVRAVAQAGGHWHRESYPLRPGRRVTVWFRQELWDRYQERGGRGVSPWPRRAVDDIYQPPIPKHYR
jgi:hypothetical protein